MDMGRPRSTGDGLPPNLYLEDGRYRWRNPATGERKWLGSDRTAAVALATKANFVLAARAAARTAPETVTIAHGVRMYLENVAPTKAWDTGTRANNTCRLRVIERELGHLAIATADRVRLGDWLAGRATSGDLHNKWRERLVDLWRYFIARGWVDYNEAEATLKRSTSAKLPENRRRRSRLELPDFWAIHETAEPWLRIAMEQSLVTLQARQEVCRMRTTDYRDGWLYVIRDKTAADTELAFLRLQLTPQLEDIKRRAMADGLHTDYLVHRRAQRDTARNRAGRPHWAAVRPEYLSKAFATARDATGRWERVPGPERPTFHEIRSLGARSYRRLGYPEAYVRALLGHADEKTTAIYLAGGELRPEQYQTVEAGLTLDALR